MNLSHLKITQAGLVALATTIIGQLVAFVPAFAPDKQVLISAASGAISAAFLIANAIHKLADSNVSASDVKSGAIDAARTEIGKVDFNKLVSDAVTASSPADLEAMVRAEAQKAVSALLGQLASAQAPVPAPAVPAPAVA